MPRARIVDHRNFRVLEKPVDGDRIIFIFTGMATRIGMYRLFVKALNARGYSCVIYDYPLSGLWRADFNEWREFYAQIMADAQGKLAAYKKHGKKHFYAYGISMGTLPANKLARDTPEITHVVLNLTYGDVASNIWSYKGVRKTKRNLEKRGITQDQLRHNIRYVDPILTAKKLQGKKVLLHLARKDKVLRHDQTKYTKKAFEDAGLDFLYSENKYLGHILAATKNMAGIRRLEKFLNS